MKLLNMMLMYNFCCYQGIGFQKARGFDIVLY